MRYALLLIMIIGLSQLARGQATCSNLALGGGFTCVQAPIPLNSATSISFANPTVAGHGVLIYVDFCTANPCATTPLPPPAANVTITDNVGDTGFQPCSSNGSTANGTRYFYCWWLPVVGAATTFTVHATGSSSAQTSLAVMEISGGCNTLNCIDNDTDVMACTTPCGIQTTTYSTNVLVTAFTSGTGTVLTPGTGWHDLACWFGGCGIGQFQANMGTYTPNWTTNNISIQTMTANIKSPSSISIQQTSIPTMPVY